MGGNTNTTDYTQTVPRSRRLGAGAGGGAGGRLADVLDDKNPEAREEIEEGYEHAADDVRITERQGESINERLESLDEVLEDGIPVKERHMIGSFTRGTMTGPFDENSDADAMYVLNQGEYGRYLNQKNGNRNLLQRVKQVIENDPRYKESNVSIDRNAVVIEYHDMKVDVVPAFERSGGGYVIPDTHSEGQDWVKTNPRRYKQMFEAVNQARNGKLERFVRNVKSWNETHGKPYGSYHLEVMAYHHVRNQAAKDKPLNETAEEFFDSLPEKTSKTRNPDAVRDPVYSDEIVDEYMDSENRQEAQEKAQAAQEKIKEARRLERAGKTDEAKAKLEEVYGRNFD